MSPAVRSAPVPGNSKIHTYLPGADFAGCHVPPAVPVSASALELYLAIMARSPTWFDALMTIRNRVGGIFGIKTLTGGMSSRQTAAALQIGDRVVMFSLLYQSESEVILEDRDRHLDVKLSLCKLEDGMAAISTVVHVHNWLGRAYMFFVAPVHRLIVPIMLARSQT